MTEAGSEWDESDESDATSAVVAHGLLGNLAVIRGAVRVLTADPALSDAERKRLLQMVDAQVDLVQGVLTDLVRGLPSHALAALDDLSGR